MNKLGRIFTSSNSYHSGMSSLLIVLILTLILELALFSVLLLSRFGIQRSLSNQYSQYAYYAVEGALNDTFFLFRNRSDWPPEEEYSDQFKVGEAQISRKISYDDSQQLYNIILDARYKGARRRIEAAYQKPKSIIEGTEDAPLDVVFVVDRSGSMCPYRDISRKECILPQMKQALIDTVNLPLFDQNDRISLVTYSMVWVRRFDEGTDYRARVDVPLTNNKSELISAINSINTEGQTNISEGMVVGADHLDQEGRPDAKKIIVLFTDGIANIGLDTNGDFRCPEDGRSAAPCYLPGTGYAPANGGTQCTDNTVNLGHLIGQRYTIFGVYYNKNILSSDCSQVSLTKEMGRRTMQELVQDSERFFETDDPEQLKTIFQQIAEEIFIIKQESFKFREVEPEND